MYAPWWQPVGLVPLLLPLRPGPRRYPPQVAVVPPRGLPIFGALNPFQFGSAVIDPGELFFRAGHPIGGPAERFRGLRASRVPFYASILGSGAPISPNGLGIAGVPIP